MPQDQCVLRLDCYLTQQVVEVHNLPVVDGDLVAQEKNQYTPIVTAAKPPLKRWTGSLPTPAPAFNSMGRFLEPSVSG